MWSEPITVSGPEATALPLATAKEFLRIDADDTGFDVEIGGWIAGVIDDLEAITGTRLISQTVELQADSFADFDRLPIGPVQEIQSIEYLDVDGVTQTLDEELYDFTGGRLSSRIVSLLPWPAIARRRPGAITVTATVGYGDTNGDIPPALTIAMLRAVRGYFDDAPIELAPLLNNHRIWL